MFLFRKYLRNENVFQTKVKLFQFFKTFFFQKKAKNKSFLGWHAWVTIQVMGREATKEMAFQSIRILTTSSNANQMRVVVSATTKKIPCLLTMLSCCFFVFFLFTRCVSFMLSFVYVCLLLFMCLLFCVYCVIRSLIR